MPEDDEAMLRRIIARDYPPQYEIVEVHLVFDSGAACSFTDEPFDDNSE